jgi:pimeloyl-ACP methyl ester carboxylesterase
VKNKLKNDPSLMVNGNPVTDASQMYYFGISLGGIQGATFMALNPDIVRGALNVGGGEWSVMMFRSTDFGVFTQLLDLYFPAPIDQAVLLHAAQAMWDYTDPISYAPHLLRDPLPGVPTKNILYQESIGDAQVPNVATRLMVRTMQMPALAPPVQEVYGITDQQQPLTSAYAQFDVHPSPLPGNTNVPPASDNQAHEACRRLPQVVDQLQRFFQPQGEVFQTCDGGPCSFCDGGSYCPP